MSRGVHMLTVWEAAANQIDPPPPPPAKWATPGDMARTLDPSTVQTSALQLIDEHLLDVAAEKLDRLMIFMPVQEGKSQRVSRRFPTWLLAHDPTLRIAIVSYQSEKAVRWGREIRRDAQTHPNLAIRLRPDDRAAGRWHTEQGGGVYCAGIGGAISGEPVDVLIIDDPIGGRAEAESPVYRERAWEWWENVGERRLSSRGRVILMTTRWHEDDLAGRILARPGGDQWTVLSIPAIAEDGDPLGRQPGEELQSAQNRKPGYFTGLAARISNYVFQAIYQQSPTAAEGNLLKRADFRYWQPMPEAGQGPRVDLGGQRVVHLDSCWKFLTVDLAASIRTSADWTVAAVWAISLEADLILLGRARKRIGESGHWDVVRNIRDRLAPDATVYVESRMFGTTLVYEAGRHGVPVQELRADADKLTRALPAADRLQTHRVWFPGTADWLDEWCDELAAFPTGTYDDQVDVLAYAARVQAAHWLPVETAEQERRRNTYRADEFTPTGVDLMNAEY
ncbi:MAG: phage terminase large subunit [Chloroflexi bacterium]|nr:phage terminase large subunit [Chloroflexota bacterium]